MAQSETERTCIVTRTVRPVEALIRFVLSPDGVVTPDLKRVLPGRGVWVTATADAVRKAEGGGVFSRGFKAPVSVAPDLADRVEALLQQDALQALSMARKAGSVVTGFAKVEAVIARSDIAGIVHARDAAADGRRKIAAALVRRFGAASGIPVITAFTTTQLDLALGRSNVIHAALLAGGASSAFLAKAARFVAFAGR